MKTLILSGIATNFGVESTARAAYERGFQQIFLGGAIAAMSEAAHTAALPTFARMGRIRSTDQVIQSVLDAAPAR